MKTLSKTRPGNKANEGEENKNRLVLINIDSLAHAMESLICSISNISNKSNMYKYLMDRNPTVVTKMGGGDLFPAVTLMK